MELERLAVPPRGPRELPLALLELGCSGRFELLSGAPGEAEGPEPRQTLPRGPPPFAPPLPAQLELRFLGTPEGLPIHGMDRARRQWLRTPDPRALFALEPTPVGGGLRAQRDPQSGALLGFAEELLPSVGLSPSNSSSLRRPPGTPGESLRGGLSSAPFCPGGWDEPTLEQVGTPGPGGEEENVDFESDLLTTPPGMKRGVEFKPRAPPGGPLSLSSLLETLESLELGGEGPPWDPPETPRNGEGPPETPGNGERPPGTPRNGEGAPETPPRRWDSLEELLDKGQESGAPPGPPQDPPEEVWAELVDTGTPLEGFEELLPNPAHKWSFRPDPFQQRAALCLEQGHSVLVAAHTSAGKTAVAEYAIGLARRHMTR
ncbi:hypothetical protein HGM15179_020892, partial [Zosterops borbonicus]